MKNGAEQPIKEDQSIHKPASWVAKIDFINQILLGTNVLISVCGEKGSGKTTFARLLQEKIDANILSVYIEASPLFEESSFIQRMNALLGNPENDLNQFICECRNSQQHTVLIIDDAHFLPESFIDSLLKSLQQQGSPGYFHICLLGNEPLIKALNNLEQSSYQEMIHTIELGALNEKEMLGYVQHRLCSQPDFLSLEQAKQFFQLTKGSIAGINAQMRSVFNLNSAANSRRPPLKKKNSHRLSLVAAAVVSALGIAFLVKPSDFSHHSSSELVMELAAPKKETALNSNHYAPFLISSIPSYDLAAVRQFMQPVELRLAALAPANEDDERLDESLVVMDKVVVAPKIVKILQNEEKKLSAVSSSALLEKAAVRHKTHEPRAVKAQLIKDHFTIQLLASHSEAKLKRFASAHNLKNNTKILTIKKQGRDWYVLTYGDYRHRELARQELAQLPSDLVKHKPWVRPFAGLHETG